MTDDTEKLIAEARRWGGGWTNTGSLIKRLADALELSERQRRKAEAALRLADHAAGLVNQALPLMAREVAARVIEGLSDEEMKPMHRLRLVALLRAPNPCAELTREAERLGMYNQGKGRLP